MFSLEIRSKQEIKSILEYNNFDFDTCMENLDYLYKRLNLVMSEEVYLDILNEMIDNDIANGRILIDHS